MSGKIISLATISDVRAELGRARAEGRSVGLVPTMGAFHEGHLSLIRAAKSENDVVVVSIFVNPTQFGPEEDFAEYPRDLEGDRKFAASAGADLIFNPSSEEMYHRDHSTWVEVKDLTEGLSGRARADHFRGVCTVVAKLFAICEPQRAYFGEKDAQQLAVIQRMVRDLDLQVDIVACPTVREADGLAMSSRNARLTLEARAQTPVLYRALVAARAAIDSGERQVAKLEDLMRSVVSGASLCEVEYVEIVRAEDLTALSIVSGTCLMAVAARFGDVRLIDNMRVSA